MDLDNWLIHRLHAMVGCKTSQGKVARSATPFISYNAERQRRWYEHDQHV